jgi:hypothetical protein
MASAAAPHSHQPKSPILNDYTEGLQLLYNLQFNESYLFFTKITDKLQKEHQEQLNVLNLLKAREKQYEEQIITQFEIDLRDKYAVELVNQAAAASNPESNKHSTEKKGIGAKLSKLFDRKKTKHPQTTSAESSTNNPNEAGSANNSTLSVQSVAVPSNPTSPISIDSFPAKTDAAQISPENTTESSEPLQESQNYDINAADTLNKDAEITLTNSNPTLSIFPSSSEPSVLPKVSPVVVSRRNSLTKLQEDILANQTALNYTRTTLFTIQTEQNRILVYLSLTETLRCLVSESQEDYNNAHSILDKTIHAVSALLQQFKGQSNAVNQLKSAKQSILKLFHAKNEEKSNINYQNLINSEISAFKKQLFEQKGAKEADIKRENSPVAVENTFFLANCEGLQGLIQYRQNSTLSALRKLKNAWNKYEKLAQIIQNSATNGLNPQNSALLGELLLYLGCFHYFLSILPQNSTVLELGGFTLDRESGWNELQRCLTMGNQQTAVNSGDSNGNNLKSANTSNFSTFLLANLAVFWLECVIFQDNSLITAHWKQIKAVYGNCPLFYYILGYFYRSQGNITDSSQCFSFVFDHSTQFSALQHYCLYELGHNSYLNNNFTAAIDYLQRFLAAQTAQSYRAHAVFLLINSLDINNKADSSLLLAQQLLAAKSWRKWDNYDTFAARKCSEYVNFPKLSEQQKIFLSTENNIAANNFISAQLQLATIANSHLSLESNQNHSNSDWIAYYHYLEGQFNIKLNCPYNAIINSNIVINREGEIKLENWLSPAAHLIIIQAIIDLRRKVKENINKNIQISANAPLNNTNGNNAESKENNVINSPRNSSDNAGSLLMEASTSPTGLHPISALSSPSSSSSSGHIPVISDATANDFDDYTNRIHHFVQCNDLVALKTETERWIKKLKKKDNYELERKIQRNLIGLERKHKLLS